ncbi:MAG: tetratricopeptide repeat protein, partial [Candidatus Gastranaerophilales bacterium]|nr:tetratricopeptide repeat protein [Candidatus Gastranaerophilales bacterium]
MTEKNKPTLDELEKELKKHPTSDELRALYAESLIDEGLLDEALVQYRGLIKRHPDKADLYYNIGIIYEKQNELKLAQNYFEKAVKLSPEDADFRYSLAFTLDRSDNVERAIDEYRKTIELNPMDSNAHFNLGCIYTKIDE